MIILNDYFIFDGVISSRYNLQVVGVNGGLMQGNFGVQKNLKTERFGNTNTFGFYGAEEQLLTVPITLASVDENGYVIPLTDKRRMEITEYLFKKEYKPIILDDSGICYYVMFKKGERFDNGIEQGYINLEMELDSPTGHSFLLTSVVENYNIKKTFALDNLSNVEEYIYPYLEIKAFENMDKLTIKNKTLNQKIELGTVKQDEIIRIYNDLKFIDSYINNVENTKRFKLFNKEWLKLVYGENEIEINGKCQIVIKMRYPMAQ